ncbi:HipA N-terminal domain-containing protein [Terrimonas pollutisoli]|uniref:HipA N-terminal domain-containing protein n=1 Tax=Terrimonas pollutisoli TaxID=3034147 RepID=UPI0023EDCC72|nr:HipA N-terminal domain-containing protein [Terrimonas sp. H1YJ31]
MAKAEVYNNGILAGYLEKRAPDDYRFTYAKSYLADPTLPSISLTLPRTKAEHGSPVLFSFFTGLLAEGINKDIQCRLLKIDEEDDFTRLLKTAGDDTIGAITVKEITE